MKKEKVKFNVTFVSNIRTQKVWVFANNDGTQFRYSYLHNSIQGSATVQTNSDLWKYFKREFDKMPF
jgi:hypothetical protein